MPATQATQMSANFKVGDKVTGGDMIGSVVENSLIQHRIMDPPNAMGTITYLAPAGNYSLQDIVVELDFLGKKSSYTMLQFWPGRRAPARCACAA